MKIAALAGNPGPLSILFEKSCVYCGARFRVLATQVAERRQQQEYECPECGKSYQTEAAGEPEPPYGRQGRPVPGNHVLKAPRPQDGSARARGFPR